MTTYIESTHRYCVRKDEKILVYHNVNFNRFVLIEFNEEANEKFLQIRAQKGIADPTPPSPTNHLAFGTYNTSLKAYLDNNKANLVYGTRMSDCLKALVCELGCIILHCSDKGIKLDIDPELENIYVANDDYPLLKFIALLGNVEEHSFQIQSMVRAFKKMEVLIYGPDPADQSLPSTSKPLPRRDNDFNNLITFCKGCVDSRTILRRFKSPFLWDKYRKYRLLSKLGQFVDACPKLFRRSLSSNMKEKLDNWRIEMQSHAQFGALYPTSYTVKVKDPWKYSADALEEEKKAIEVDNLLILIRATVMHFDTMCKGLVPSCNELVDFYETEFPDIMSVIYAGVENVQRNGKSPISF